jgi:hypothetical protein
MTFMTPKEAAVALVSHETDRGPRNGSFATALLNAFQCADRDNTARLLHSFPEFTAPLKFATQQGIDVLEAKIAEGYFDQK